jgi:Microtubule binding/Filamin/ABP280 repeat
MVDRGDGTYTLQFVPSHEGTTSVHVMLDGAHVRGSPMALSVHRDVDELARGALTGKLSNAVTGLRRGLAATRRMQNSLRSEAEGLLQYVPVLVQSAASDLAKLMAEQQALLKEAREAVHREARAQRSLFSRSIMPCPAGLGSDMLKRFLVCVVCIMELCKQAVCECVGLRRIADCTLAAQGGERRRLHNLVQELRGNIRVYVRVKPLTPDEAATGTTPVLKCSSDASRIECNAGTSTKAFDFDRVFHERSTQQQVFSEVAGLITSALDGCTTRTALLCCCCFAAAVHYR